MVVYIFTLYYEIITFTFGGVLTSSILALGRNISQYWTEILGSVSDLIFYVSAYDNGWPLLDHIT